MGYSYEDQIKDEQRSISRYQERLSNIHTLIHILTKFAVSSHNLEEQRLMKYYEKFASASSKRMQLHYLKKIIEYLDRCNDKSVSFDLDVKGARIEQTKNLRPEYRQQLEYAEMHMRHHIEDDIVRLCNEYFDLINCIEESKKRIRELQKEVQKSGRKEETRPYGEKIDRHEEKKQPPRFMMTGSTDTKDSGGEKTEKQKIEKKKEETSTEKDDDLSNYRKKIKEYITNDQTVYLSQTVDPLIDNYMISEKFKKTGYLNAGLNYDPEDVLDFALNVYNILPAYLEQKHNIKNGPIKDFYTKLDIENSFADYERIYDKYMRAYAMMSPSSKEYHNQRISTYSKKGQYERFFGKNDFSSPKTCMLSPEELRKFVNTKITNDMSELSQLELSTYFSIDDQEFASSTPRLENVTQYMNEEEITKLYRVMKNKWNSEHSYSSTTYDPKKEAECLKIFQERFIYLLAHKMYNEKEVKMTAQEWNDFVQSKYKEICAEILEEQPLTASTEKGTQM